MESGDCIFDSTAHLKKLKSSEAGRQQGISLQDRCLALCVCPLRLSLPGKGPCAVQL